MTPLHRKLVTVLLSEIQKVSWIIYLKSTELYSKKKSNIYFRNQQIWWNNFEYKYKELKFAEI